MWGGAAPDAGRDPAPGVSAGQGIAQALPATRDLRTGRAAPMAGGTRNGQKAAGNWLLRCAPLTAASVPPDSAKHRADSVLGYRFAMVGTEIPGTMVMLPFEGVDRYRPTGVVATPLQVGHCVILIGGTNSK